MKRLVIGILAHVDAGKTTLCEGLLYKSGVLRALGRVDRGNAFLDTDVQERERGITIFSKQALLSFGDAEITLLDTPGHVDFSAETERTLQVLDYAILVISGTDGVQSHTRTLWQLLKRHKIPVFLFINKMDLAGAEKEKLKAELCNKLDSGCVDFSAELSLREEALALCAEEALEEYLKNGKVKDETVKRLIRERRIFPCWFGAALKLEGVEGFLSLLQKYTEQPKTDENFGARVFKINRDTQGARLTWMKITSGTLRVKTVLPCGEEEEKVDQLRLYSGQKFRPIETAEAGMIVAATGMKETKPGQALGTAKAGEAPVLEPVLTYQLLLPPEADPHTALAKLRQLEEEDPLLRILWNARWKEIHVQLMGPIQLEVLRRLIADRFGLNVDFGTGSIVYKETIAAPVEGMGHFEPLRHYAEVHLLMEPGPRGSGIRVATACPTDKLELNWQRLILTHLLERDHPGVLTGSPITDLKITLVAGRAHVKHTEGGDFRQATYRAVRQGLMQAQTVLLEPYYNFRIELPGECVGRAMTDIQAMGGSVEAPEEEGEQSILIGFAPVERLRDYYRELTVYTRGRGRLSCTLRGYEPCRNQEEIAAAIDYEAERDVENPADSVFCSHGAGFTVKWYDVPEYIHIQSGLDFSDPEPAAPEPSPVRRSAPTGDSFAQDKDLQAIFERTYGKVEDRSFQPQKKPARVSLDDSKRSIAPLPSGPEYLLVDGYNIIFAWKSLKKLAEQDIAAARSILTDILSNYQAFRKCVLILVFDAYKVKGNSGSIEKQDGIYVVYTKEAQTADAYIEKATYELRHERRVRVATSDHLEQMIILGHGAVRISARIFEQEIEQAQGEIDELIARHNLKIRENRSLRYVAQITQQEKSAD